MDKQAINRARSAYYGLLSALFAFIDNGSDAKQILQMLNDIEKHAINPQTQESIKNIKSALQQKGLAALKKENTEIFFDPYGGHIPMTASYCLEQRDDGKMRILMLDYVLKSEFRRNEARFKENEDHIHFILEFMCALTSKNSSKNEEIAKEVFSNVLNLFIDEIIVSVYEHKNAFIYKDVAIILKSFIELERIYLGVQKPKKEVQAKVVEIEKKVTKPFTKKIERNMDEIEL